MTGNQILSVPSPPVIFLQCKMGHRMCGQCAETTAWGISRSISNFDMDDSGTAIACLQKWVARTKWTQQWMRTPLMP